MCVCLGHGTFRALPSLLCAGFSWFSHVAKVAQFLHIVITIIIIIIIFRQFGLCWSLLAFIQQHFIVKSAMSHKHGAFITLHIRCGWWISWNMRYRYVNFIIFNQYMFTNLWSTHQKRACICHVIICVSSNLNQFFLNWRRCQSWSEREKFVNVDGITQKKNKKK